MMRFTLVRTTRLMLIAGLGLTTLAASLLAAPPAGYMDYAAITKYINEIASPTCRVDHIGKSGQGRDIHVLILSNGALNVSDDLNDAATRPALLIVAGLDARHRVGIETALRVAKSLSTDHADLLKTTTVYIIPCANPDGLEYNNGQVNYGHIGNMHPVDDDRDFATDEDGPQDLNGDGVITQMRRLNPPLDDTATMMADPAASRLLKKPNAEKGERAVYSISIEGLDVDGDGKIAEDAVGSVDLDKNFMHRWPEHDNEAGEYQLSEPESAALAKFVLEHRNIVEAITYGRHDNLINTPDGKAKDITGEAPKDLDSGDADYYKEIGKLYKDTTGQERAPQNDTAGSFHVWLYAERGIPSFATVVWGRPEASKPKEAETKPADSQPASQPDAAASKPSFNMGALTEEHDDSAVDDQQDQQPPAGGGRRGRRPGGAGGGGGPRGGESASGEGGAQPGGGGGGGEKKDDKPKPADAEAAAWLDYSDRDRNHEGFIEWTAFDHPSLGKVEIGGFVPGFQMNPPADQLDSLAEKQTKFVVEMLKKQPKITVDGPVVKKLAPGLYEVRFGVLNDGYLPTATAMARRARSVMPTNVRISTPIENIVTGDRLSKVYGITGGERWSTRWILRADDGSEITIEMTNPQLGDQKIVFKAEEHS